MKVLVIGSGVVGACAAFYLSQRKDCEVILADKASRGKATLAGAGIICPWISRTDDEDWFRIASSGAQYYPELIQALEALGETNTGYKQTGALATSRDLNVISTLEEKVRKKKEDFPVIGETRVLEAPQAQRFFPGLNDELHGLFISGAARLDGRLLAESLVAGVKKNNGKVIREQVTLEHSGKEVRANAGGKAIEADQIIAAGGAWMNELLAPLAASVPVVPQRGQIVHLTTEEDTSDLPLILPQESSHYIVPFDDSRIAFGASREDDTGFDYRLTASGVQEVLNEGLKVAPGLADYTLKDIRIGFRPMSPDNKPLLGKLPEYDNLIIATGLGSSGLTMGPYVGSLAAKIASGEEPELDLQPYRPNRA
jgi:D-amino-acid dehydrogenase